MTIFKNLKDPITDIFGLGIMLITSYEVYQGDIKWIWEGLAGVGVGALFFMFPDDLIKDFLKKIVDKFTK